MRRIKCALTALIGLTLIFLIEAGLAQTVKNQPIPTQDVKLVKVIKNCSVPYITTKKLYAVVETSSGSPEKEAQDKRKSTANEQRQTVQQTYEFAISPDVEVRENGKKGLKLDIKTLAAVGFITKADIYLMKNEVVRIIILDMQQ